MMTYPEKPDRAIVPTQKARFDKDADDASTEEDEGGALLRLEAALFLSREPLHSRRLAHLANLADGTQARTLAKRLNRLYDEHGTAFQVQQVAGGFQLRTRPQFSTWLRQQQHVPRPARLTGPAMETLSVIAYRQPATKADIEAVRGVSCGELLRQLLDRGLVRISGRSAELGQPFLYSTTRKFLEVFGLARLDALPRSNQLSGTGLPSWVLGHGAEAKKRGENNDDPLDERRSTAENQRTEVVNDRHHATPDENP